MVPQNDAYPINTEVSFTCDYGYFLNGSDSSTCQSTGDWDPQTPTCNKVIKSMLDLTITSTQFLLLYAITHSYISLHST